MASAPPMNLLVINPNSSEAITKTFPALLSDLVLPNIFLSYFTAPTGPAILKSYADNLASAEHSLPPLLPLIPNHDGFLIACYAEHALVPLLRKYTTKPVVGIFEASISSALGLLSNSQKFGIVTTGLPYQSMLTDGVINVLGRENGAELQRFSSVQASGIGLPDLSCRKIAREKLLKATKKLVESGDVGVICIGGVILAGLEEFVREGCVQELGVDRGENIRIVDQMVAGVVTLEGLVREQERF